MPSGFGLGASLETNATFFGFHSFAAFKQSVRNASDLLGLIL